MLNLYKINIWYANACENPTLYSFIFFGLSNFIEEK